MYNPRFPNLIGFRKLGRDFRHLVSLKGSSKGKGLRQRAKAQIETKGYKGKGQRAKEKCKGQRKRAKGKGHRKRQRAKAKARSKGNGQKQRAKTMGKTQRAKTMGKGKG